MDGDAPARCTRTNTDGRPCNAAPWRDGQCRWHHPDLEGERQAGRRKGGVARSNANRARRQLPVNVLTPVQLQGVLSTTIARVLGGQVEPGVGNCVANLARALVAAREATTTEERLAELERLAGVADERGRA